MATKKKQKKVTKQVKKSNPKKKRKAAARGGARVLNMKATRKQAQTIVNKAKKYTNGNVSQWLRTAGTSYTPKATAQNTTTL